MSRAGEGGGLQNRCRNTTVGPNPTKRSKCSINSVGQSNRLLSDESKVRVLDGALIHPRCSVTGSTQVCGTCSSESFSGIGILFVSITVVQVTLTHLMLVRFQHEQLLQEFRHTHKAHIFVAVGSAPIPATNSPSPSWLWHLPYKQAKPWFKSKRGDTVLMV